MLENCLCTRWTNVSTLQLRVVETNSCRRVIPTALAAVDTNASMDATVASALAVCVE